ncbi:MAG: CBS domain-containing protein [Thioalkalivibrio sp.]|nr:MAG: CBS domain-containing protein [Thioalkalivibrio sp.]
MLDVSDIMTPRQNLVVMRPESTVEEVRRAMAANKIRHLPVLDGNGALVGLVSQTDVLVAGNGGARTVHEIMIRDPETVDERDNVRHAALLMVRHKRSCLPVIREKELRGIVTDSDFLGVAIALMEQSEAVEPDADDFEGPDEL